VKSVALYGFASVSRDGVWHSSADEIWSIAWAYKYNVPRLDLLLEIHPIWYQATSQLPEYQKVRDHWEWLKQNQTIPVYMTEARPEVPACVVYPLAEVQKLVAPARCHKVFTSSFDFLMGLAILKGFDRIEVYGFEMGSETEYRYQREGAAYWIAQADARGIEVILPEKTALLKNKIYMLEGGAMIYRQDLERHLENLTQQHRDAAARLAHIEGQLHALKEMQADNATMIPVADEWDKQYRIMLVTSGAKQEIEFLLKEIDLEQPDMEFIDPYERIGIKA
jgi:hypothetical protein